MATTIYDIKLRYSLDDKAGKGIDGIEAGAARAAASTGVLSGMLGRLGMLAAGGFGIGVAAKSLVGFNATVQDTKLQIGGMLALTKKTDLADEMANADRIFANLQKRAMTLPGTTQEYAHFAGMITRSIIDAGLSMKDLENLTVSSVVAAKSLGEEAGVAARDIDQALRGMYRSVDPFSSKVLGSIGYSGEEGRKKFNALSAQDRAGELKRALSQKQWDQLAAGLGQTFNGVMSTVQDTLQQTLGKVGLPLFKAISAELVRWNQWAAANGATLDQWGADIGSALVDGFRFVKDAVSFLIDHKQVLIDIGKVWLAVQAGKMLGGVMSGLGGMAGGLSALAKPVTFAGAAGSMGALAYSGMVGWQVGRQIDEWTGIGSILMEPVARLAGVWDDAAASQAAQMAKIEAAMDRMDKAVQGAAESARAKNLKGAAATQAAINLQGMIDIATAETQGLQDKIRTLKKRRDWEASVGWVGWADSSSTDSAIAQAQSSMGAASAREAALRSKLATGTSNADSMLAAALAELTDEQRKGVDVEKTTQEVMGKMIQALSGNLPFKSEIPMFGMATGLEMEARTGPRTLTAQEVMGIIREVNGLETTSSGKKPMKAPGKVNVTIQRIEVKSDDPDRFAFGLVESLRSISKNPSGAAAAIREG